jgi:CxxC-x17-CxxC domain-containing protein
MEEEITILGETIFRNQKRKFGIKLDDRRRHIYVIGKTGMGKTVLLENMAIQDILAGRGIGFIDPHGEAAEELLDYIPKNRINDVVYFNPADIDFPIAFNVMEKIEPEYRHLVAAGLMGVFKKIWPDVWSARMEYILNNTILALLEYPNTTLLGINRMLADPEYRKKIVEKITDPVVKSFWVNEFARYSQTYEVEATAAIQNKVGQFISNPLIRNIIGQVKSKINMRKIMDEGKILIANLSKGKIGEDNSRLLGALLITKLQLAAMSRVDIPEEERRDFFLYVDEFQNFATEAFVNILSEARKYRLSLVLANQYIAQLEEMTPLGRSTRVRDAIFGNVGTIIVFRVGAEDAEFLEKEFQPEFTAQDLINLEKYHICIKLMIDGVASSPFSAITLPKREKPEKSYKDVIIRISRQRYGTERNIVEEKIEKWAGTRLQIPILTPKQILYNAQCSICGKKVKVPFLPDPSRPVYCKSCLKKIEKEKEEETISLSELKPTTEKSEKEKQKETKKSDIESLKKVLEKIFQEDEKNK